MVLEVLISTINDGIYKVKDILLPPREDVIYSIIFQYTGDIIDVPDGLKRKDINVYPLAGKGVTRSRNFGIEQLKGDVGLFADDDV